MDYEPPSESSGDTETSDGEGEENEGGGGAAQNVGGMTRIAIPQQRPRALSKGRAG